MKKFKKSLIALLSVCMIVTMMPLGVWAGETEGSNNSGDSSPTVAENTVVELTEDTEMAVLDPNTTYDLKGYNLTYTGGTLVVESTNTLKFIDSTVSGDQRGGTLKLTGVSSTNAAFQPKTGGKVIAENINITCTGSAFYPCGDAAEVTITNCDVQAAVYCVATNAAKADNYKVKITLENSTVTSSSDDGDNCAVMINVPSTLNIDNCTITGDRQAVMVRAGDATISNSDIRATGKYEDSNDYEDTKAWGSGNEVPMAALIVGSQTNAYKANAVCTVTDTEISAPEDKSKPAVYVSSNNDTQTGTTYTSQLNISGEKTKITGDMVAADGKADEPASVIVKDNAVITGNITNNSVASAIAVIDGAAVSGTTTVKESTNGTIFVEGEEDESSDIVALNTVTGKPYQDLASAFSEVKDGETIRLEKNVQLDNTVNINKSTTVDLNGKTITSDTVAFKAAIQDGTFTIKDSKENGKITSNNKSNLIEIKEGELVVEGGELSNDWYVVYVYQSGKATIHGGTLVSDVASAVSTNGSAAGQENYSGNAVITITGGEVTSTNDVAVYLPAGKLNISDGKITGATAVYCKAGTTNITGGEITGTGAKAEFVHSNNGCSATGDAIVIEACNYPNGNPAFEISDGKVISQNANAIGSYNTDNNSAEKLEVSGGEYSSSVAEYVVDSLNAELHKSSGDALYSYYTSVENAIAAASANDTVTDLTAAASNDTFTVTLNYTNEVTPTVKYTLEEKDDTKFTFPANNPSRSGYTFLGWKTENDDKLYKAEEEYSVTTNVEFTAQWSRNSSGGSGGGSSTPSYTISADKADNGSVSVSPQSAKKGDTVTVTLKPESGYELDKLTVKDSDGKEVTVTDKGDGKYTFTMPASKVTVSAAFKKTAAVHDCPSKNFTDVDTAQWYHEGVDYVVEKGMMNGVSSTSFAPNADTTRGMIVTILYRLEGSPAVASAASFSDVAAGQYYADAVAWASANGIVTGYDSSKFGPNDKITREQLAAILYRYAGFKKYDVSKTSDLSSYTDSASISGYAADALKWANAESLINGVGDSRIAPQGSAVRAQAATILMRFCENVAK